MAQDVEWVEAMLIDADEVEILFGGASSCAQQGKADCVRVMLLAASPGMQGLLQRTVIPRNRQLLQQYDALAPVAYGQHNPQPLAAVISQHEAKLVELAEQQALPPVGPSFENKRDRVQRVLAARAGEETAKNAILAYGNVAPDAVKHMETKDAKKVLRASRSIVFSLVTLPDHVRLATDVAKSEAVRLKGELDAAVSAENLSQITSLATSEEAYAGYLEQLGLDGLAETHGEHAKWGFAEAKRIHAARIARNRIPAEQYRGGDAESLRKLVASQFTQKYPGSEVLTVRLSGSDFRTQWEWVELNSGSWAWRKVRQLQFAYVAYRATGDNGEVCHVFPMRIEQLSSGGGFGKPYAYRPAQYYPFDMLVKNL